MSHHFLPITVEKKELKQLEESRRRNDLAKARRQRDKPNKNRDRLSTERREREKAGTDWENAMRVDSDEWSRHTLVSVVFPRSEIVPAWKFFEHAPLTHPTLDIKCFPWLRLITLVIGRPETLHRSTTPAKQCEHDQADSKDPRRSDLSSDRSYPKGTVLSAAEREPDRRDPKIRVTTLNFLGAVDLKLQS